MTLSLPEASNIYDLKIIDEKGKVVSATDNSTIGNDLSQETKFLNVQHPEG